ncbi:MAG: diguanylate cyclase [Pseudomonadota bacterium]
MSLQDRRPSSAVALAHPLADPLADAAVVRASFESAPDGVLVLARDGRILAYNWVYRRLWNFSDDMLARRNALEWRQHTARQLQDPQAYLQGMDDLLGTAQSRVFDTLALLDGRVFERHVSPMEVPGTPPAVVVRWRDITERHRAEQALAGTQARLTAIFQHALNAILLASDDGIYLDANPAACSLLGYSHADLVGRAVAELVVPEREHTPSAWFRFRQAGSASGRVRLRRRDGSVVEAQYNAVANVLPGVHLSVLSDVSEELRHQQRQQELTALMDLAMMDADLVFWDADLRSGRMSSVNGHWHAMLGYTRDEVADTLDAWDALVHPDDATGRLLAWEAHLLGSTSTFEAEFRVRHKRGHWVWMQARGRVVERSPSGEPLRVAGLRMNITRRKETEARLQGLAHTDALTGVLNRRRFTDLAADELSRAQRHATPVALLMIDLDHFKAVNDKLGHAGGDAVLRSFAATAESVMRQGDVFGRVGGEEFAALLPQTTLAGAVVVAERLRQRIQGQPAQVGSVELAFTVSIGVSAWAGADSTEPDIDRLMVAADRALYAAKAQGRDRVVADAPPDAAPGIPPDTPPATPPATPPVTPPTSG